MKITLLHYAAHPIVGGVESVMHRHSLLMADAGHHVTVIAGRGEQTDPRVDFIRVPLVDSRDPAILEAKRELDGGRIPGDFLRLSMDLEDQLRVQFRDTDWVMAHNVCSLNKNLPLTAALRRIADSADGPRLALWHHDLAWTTPRYKAELHSGHPWDLLRTDWPDTVQIAVSRHRAQELTDLLKAPKGRVRVIPNGVDVAAFLSLGPEALGLIDEFRLLDSDPLILLPARITPRKNIEMALRVLASLRESHPAAKLLVTGPTGPHNPANSGYLESLIELRRELSIEVEAVFLATAHPKTVSDKLLLDLYRLADVLFFPSREEGFGIPLLEAGLERIPVFCADIEVLREVGGRDVEYFPSDGDPRSVAKRVADTLAANKGHRLRKRVLLQYAWNSIYARHIAPLLEDPGS
jgi:glycosyltransferase involved in cell wall biosynthesis